MASLLLLGLTCCALRPSRVADADHLVLVKSARLPERGWLPWYARFAEHAWIDVKDTRGWHRIEWNQHLDHIAIHHIDVPEPQADERWERSVAVHATFSGARAQSLATQLLAAAPNFPAAADYRAWPGCNSNTFIDWLARTTGLPVDLPPNAVGKDYTPWLRAGVSSTGLGLELETALLGVQLGLHEGAELHVLGLTLGVGIWPPQVKLPFVPAIPCGWM